MKEENLRTLASVIEQARGGDINAFSALCVRDHQGSPIDLAPIHLTINAFVDYCWAQTPPLYAGVLAPWRHGKSLLGPIGRTALEIGRQRETRVRLVCADDREATLRVAAIRRIIESKRFQRVFPLAKPHQGEWLKHQFTVERESIGPDPSVAAAGVFSVEAGGGHDILMFDDIVTYQNSYLTPAMRPAIYDALISVWLRRIDPNVKVLNVGTAWHYDDANHRLMRAEHRAQWRWLIIRVAENFRGLTCEVQ